MPLSATTTRVLRGMLVLLSCVLVAQDKPKSGSLTEVQIQNQEQLTRVTVFVSGVIDIKSDRLENPPRLFIDFANTVRSLAGRTDAGPRGAMQAIAAEGPLLKQIRVAENQNSVTRLVFDLATAEIDSRTMVLSEPNRLVVELRPKKTGGQVQNPLARPMAPSVSGIRAAAGPRKFIFEVPEKKAMGKPVYYLPDPPVLISSVRLPKVEALHVPLALREPGLKVSPTAVNRQAVQSARAAVAASRTGTGRQSLTRVLGLKIGKVVIDPGHGGHDAGSTGATGLVEKDVTLDVAKRLAILLQDTLGSEVILTRNEDVYISPEQRTVIANQHHADLFISIHANSSPLKTATGIETYYLNFTSSPEALEVAARENASSERSVSDLGELIKKIALKDKLDESREFANKLQQSLLAGSTKAGNRTKDRGVRKAPFIVLIGAGMPSVLTEIGFLSNPREEALLKRADYRQKIAESLLRGIQQYTDTLSHFNVAQSGQN